MSLLNMEQHITRFTNEKETKLFAYGKKKKNRCFWMNIVSTLVLLVSWRIVCNGRGQVLVLNFLRRNNSQYCWANNNVNSQPWSYPFHDKESRMHTQLCAASCGKCLAD